MSAKIGIRKILIFVVSLALVMTGLAACATKVTPKSQVTTNEWDGSQTLEKVLGAVGSIQEGGKNSENELSIDSEFELYANDLSLSLRIQAYFDLADRKARQAEEGYISKDQLLIELTDAKTLQNIGGVYVKDDKVFVSVAGLNFTISDIDALKGVGEGVSSVMGVDLGAALGGLELPVDITSILGGFLFPSASVVTEAPLKGNSGETTVTIVAEMDIGTVLSAVFGMFGMVNDMAGNIGAKDGVGGISIDALLADLTGHPLITKYDGDGNPIDGVLGFDEILSDAIGLKPITDGNGKVVYDGKPFAGTKLYMKFIDDKLDDFRIDGGYAPYEKDSIAFGFRIADFDVATKGLVINFPENFKNDFDFFSIRLGGYGTIPDVGDIEIVFDIRLDSKNLENTKILLEVTNIYSGEHVIAGYYQYEKNPETDKYEGYIYLNLEAVDISYVKINAQKMGIGKIKIDGFDIAALMNSLVDKLTKAAGEIVDAGDGTVSAAGVYGISAEGVELDINYLIGLLSKGLSTKDGRVDIDITSEMIAGLLTDIGLEALLNETADGLLGDATIKKVFDAINLIGIDLEDLVTGLGNKVVSFITGLDPAVQLSAYIESEDRNPNESGSFGPGLGLAVSIKGEVYYIDLFVKDYGDGKVQYNMPADLASYKAFDYSTVSFNGTAAITNVGDVTYRITVSGIDTVKKEKDGTIVLSGLTMSWVAYDYNKAVIMGVYYDGATGKAYINLGDETRFLGFKFSDMGLDRLFVDINLEEIVNKALNKATPETPTATEKPEEGKPDEGAKGDEGGETDGEEGPAGPIDENPAGPIDGEEGEGNDDPSGPIDEGDGEGNDDPAEPIDDEEEEAAAPEKKITLALLLKFLDIQEFKDGKTGASLTNSAFVDLVTEIVGEAAMERLENLLPPVSASAYLDALNLVFGFNVEYFNERIAFDADLQTLYIGTDEPNGIFKAARVPEDEIDTYKTIEGIMTNITLQGQVDLPGVSMKDLTFEIIISNLLDLDNLSISFEAKIAAKVLFSVYYNQSDKAIFVDMGLLSVFGLDIAKMNIKKIIVPNIDLAALLKNEVADEEDEIPVVVSGGSATGDAADAPKITLDDVFGWITGSYNDGKIVVGTRDEKSFLNILQKVLSEQIYSYIGNILPPAVLEVALDTNIGELGITLQIALEKISFTLEKVVFGTGAAVTDFDKQNYTELSVEGLMDNIVIQGVATIPGGVGQSKYTLIISNVNSSENFAVSLETFNAAGIKDFSIYYSLEQQTAYIDFGSFSMFAFSPELFNIKKLKLMNLKLDVKAMLDKAKTSTTDDDPTTETESVISGKADGTSESGLNVGSIIQEIFSLVVMGYDSEFGILNLSLFEEAFVKSSMDMLGEALYARIGALIPGAEAIFSWDTVNGIINFGFGTYQTTESGRGFVEGFEIGIERIYFGKDTSLGNGGAANCPSGEAAATYRTLEDTLRKIQLKGTGTLPGAGEVEIEINLHIELETTENSEFSIVMKHLTDNGAYWNKGDVAFALYNFGSYIYADISDFYFGEINPGALFASKIKIEGINVADMVKAALGEILESFKEIAHEEEQKDNLEDENKEVLPGASVYDHNVTIVYNNGTETTPGTVAVVGVNNGDRIPAAELNKAKKEGLVLDRWYSDEALTVPFDAKNTQIVSSITIYATYALWYDTTTFIQMYNIVNAELSPLHAQATITPEKWNQLVSLIFEINLNALISQFNPSISIDVNLMDLFGVGFDLSVNTDSAAGTKDNVLGFRLSSFSFGTANEYRSAIGADEDFKKIDDLLADFQIRAKVDMDITAQLNNAVGDNTLNNFINNLLTLTDEKGVVTKPLGDIEIKYTNGASINYHITADIAIDRDNIYNTDILIELKRDGSTLIFGFYIDDGIGYIDLSGLVGESGYTQTKGLRLAINEINIMGILQTLIPDTLTKLDDDDDDETDTGTLNTLSGASAATPTIALNMSAQLLRTIMGLLTGSVDGAEDPIPNINFDNFIINLNTLSASGIVKMFDSIPNQNQLILNVSANIDASRDGKVDFGGFGANKKLFTLFNVKAGGLGELGVILSLIDNTISSDTSTTELFSGTILVQNKESLNNARPDTNVDSDIMTKSGQQTQVINGKRYYNVDNVLVGDGQTSDIYIFKIRDGNFQISGENDPQAEEFSGHLDKEGNLEYGNRYEGLNGALGILIDVAYNFSVKVQNIQLNGYGTSGSALGTNSNIYAQGDLDMAYFFALTEDSLNVYARIGGEIRLNSSGVPEKGYYRIQIAGGVGYDVEVALRDLLTGALSEFTAPTMYQLISLTSIPISIKDIANQVGDKLPAAVKEITGEAELTGGAAAADPMVKKTTIDISSNATSIEIELNAQALDKALVEFENGFLAELVPGTTIDINASTNNRYVAESVWQGVAGMIVGFVMNAGAVDPRDDIWTTGFAYGNADDTFHGADTSGQEDMMRFINALLPLPRLYSEDSTAKVKLGFKSGKLSTVDVELMGVMTAGSREKLILKLEHKSEADNIGLSQATKVGDAVKDEDGKITAISDKTLYTAQAGDPVLKQGTQYFNSTVAYATLANYENTTRVIGVRYDGNILKEQKISWDFTPIRDAIASGAALETNTKFTIGGYVANSAYGAKMDVYIIDGKNDIEHTDAKGTYYLVDANPKAALNIDPYDGIWKSRLNTKYAVKFFLENGNSITTGNIDFTLDTSSVQTKEAASWNKDYGAYLRWDGLVEPRTIHVSSSVSRTVIGTSIPSTQFHINNAGWSSNDYKQVTVNFDNGYNATYDVTWNTSATGGKSYGTVDRTGTIVTPTQTYTVEQKVTVVYLMTDRVEYRNNYGPTVNGNGPLAINQDSENQGRIYFIDVDGKAKYTLISAVNMNGTPEYAGFNGSTTEVHNGQFYNGGNLDKNTILVTLSNANWQTALNGKVVPIKISYGPNWDLASGASYGNSPGNPRTMAGAYIDTSINPNSFVGTNNNVYSKVVTLDGTLTSNDMPIMVTRAAMTVDVDVPDMDTQNVYFMEAYSVADLHINWDFSGVDLHTANEYIVKGRIFYKNVDTKTLITCIVKVIPPKPSGQDE